MSLNEREPRLLIYSQDGLGLGHLRRTTLLAAEFLHARPDGSVLTICDSPVGQFFATATGHDYLKLPSIYKLGPGNWSPVSLSSAFTDVLSVRKETIRSAALSFAPDVVLVDHMPHGAMGELVPTLDALTATRARMVLGLRDILDAPATVRRRWRLEGAFVAVERHFEDVLVYGSRDVFDVGVQYAWPSHLQDRLKYCGYVCSPTAATARDAVRRRFLGDQPDARLVVAMAGGGADGFALFDALLRAIPLLSAAMPCSVLAITGPFLPRVERARLQPARASRAQRERLAELPGGGGPGRRDGWLQHDRRDPLPRRACPSGAQGRPQRRAADPRAQLRSARMGGLGPSAVVVRFCARRGDNRGVRNASGTRASSPRHPRPSAGSPPPVGPLSTSADQRHATEPHAVRGSRRAGRSRSRPAAR